MMATVSHVISGLGLRKFQADGFCWHECTLKATPQAIDRMNITAHYSYKKNNVIEFINWSAFDKEFSCLLLTSTNVCEYEKRNLKEY